MDCTICRYFLLSGTAKLTGADALAAACSAACRRDGRKS
jgi:hypothetical protein